MRTPTRSRLGVLALAAGCLFGVAACSSSSDNSSSSSSGDGGGNGEVSITVNCWPPTSDPIDRKNFSDDIASFQKLHPNIHITPKGRVPV